MQAFNTDAHVRPGGTASYVIWVWTTSKKAKDVKVSLSARHVSHVAAPRFTVCPKADGAVCTVGTLPLKQADELKVGVKVHGSASAGGRITLTAKARAAAGATGSRDKATITIAAAPSPTITLPPLPAATIPAGALPAPPGAATSPTDPSGLFPTVSPSPDSGSGRGTPGGKSPKHLRITTTSATVPLDSRLLGGQIAGLAVLAGAVAVAIARLSLRKHRPADRDAAQK
jgi:hypothetical protein